MKKKNLFKAFGAALALSVCLSSCSTLTRTSTTYDVNDRFYSANEAELTVSTKKAVLTDWKAPKKVRKGGMKNMKSAAVAELLQQNGDADVLIAPQFETYKNRITVKGYPAKYTKFQPQKSE